MRIYIFKSEGRTGLRAFAGDVAGNKLPSKHGPWTATGIIGADRPAPHGFARAEIENAIEEHGFQLWRLRAKADA